MFGIAPSELFLVALVAVIFVGPKDLPRVMRVLGELIGKGRAMRRHVYGAINQVVGEIETADIERKRKSDIASIRVETEANLQSTGTPEVFDGVKG